MNIVLIVIIVLLVLALFANISSQSFIKREMSDMVEKMTIYKLLISFIINQVRYTCSEEIAKNIVLNAVKRMGNVDGIKLCTSAEQCADAILKDSLEGFD